MDRSPILALFGANGIFAALVLLLGWGYYQAAAVLWLEILIVGLYGIAGIYVTALFGHPLGRWGRFESPASAVLWTSCLVGLFTLHFGGLLLAPGIAVLALPALLSESGSAGPAVVETLQASIPGIAVGAGALFVSHGVAFATDFIGRREYEHASLVRLLFSPYLRVLQLLLTLGIALAVAFVQPVVSRRAGFAVALVAVRGAGEVATRLWRRRRPAGRPMGSNRPRAGASVS